MHMAMVRNGKIIPDGTGEGKGAEVNVAPAEDDATIIMTC